MVCLCDLQVKKVGYIGGLTLKSEVWARNTDFGVITADVVDKSPGVKTGGLGAIMQEGADLGFPNRS